MPVAILLSLASPWGVAMLSSVLALVSIFELVREATVADGQAIMTLSSASFKPYSLYAAAANCPPSTTLS